MTEQQSTAALVVIEPASQAGLVMVFSQPDMLIGREATADFVLDTEYVSRQHARVTTDTSGQVTITDINSVSGTFVNGERLTAPRVLQPGDVVRIADVVARFERATAAEKLEPHTEIISVASGRTAVPAAAQTSNESAVAAGTADGGTSRGPADDPSIPASGDGQVAAAEPTVVIAAAQTNLTQLGYTIPADELRGGLLGAGTSAALQQFQSVSALAQTGEPDAATMAALTAAITDNTYVVSGSVQSPALPSVPGVEVRLVDKNVGGDQLLASSKSSVNGSYSFSVVVSPAYLATHSKSEPDFQVQALANGNVLASSQVQYSAPKTVALDVVVPATAAGLPSEYETLTASLRAAYSGNLADLQEDSTRQDITYLANKTGWDARMVALAALSDQFSRITPPATATGTATTVTNPSPKAATTTDSPEPAAVEAAPTVRPEFYYALFRAGLPANDVVFQANPSTVQALWQQAIAQGVIPQTLSKEIPAATAAFQKLSAAKILTAAPTVGVSTLAEMLQSTLPDASQQELFAQLYTQYASDPDELWPAVEKALGDGATTELKSLGSLYYLTLNNQPLVAALVRATSNNGATAPSSTLNLATSGYYEASAWTPLIADGTVPPQVPGADASEQASNYAELLAAQVRLAYPTAVLADQVRRGVLPIADTDQVADDVVDFLNTQQGNFEIGVEPVEAFIARTGASRPSDAVITQVKRLQRVYQLTPDDTSMATLLNHNLDSAYSITRYDSAGFVRTFSAQLGGDDTASAIHARASQVFVSVLGVVTDYLKGRVTPTLGGSTPIKYGSQPPANPPTPSVVAYPTLENLFGSLDYCACSDCSSILSPAAYFVDLLHFIDQPAPSAGLQNPQDALFARRPDLQYLNLTCANTNTALPYIDIVNETLEYYVANGLSIDGYQGNNTSNTITSAELVASPQYVNDDAYTLLNGTYFPLVAPFNRPLTLLRLQLQSMGIQLSAAMQALRTNDKLTNTASPTSYGWRDILIEQLGISREEYRLFTDTPLYPGDPLLDLGDLYGLSPTLSTAAQQLKQLQTTSLQDFSRRLGVSYDDFVAIVQTQFLNPNAALIPLLEQLNCTFATLEQLNADPAANSAAFVQALPAGLDATQYGATTPDDYSAVVTWVTANYSRIVGIITLTNPTGNADDCSGADLYFQYTNPTSPDLSGTDFLKLIRFIRLWQKLAPLLAESDDAAAIADTDNILAALYPPAEQPLSNNDATNQSKLDAGFTTLLLRLGFLVQVMNQLSLSADTSLGPLLACWADIGTVGTGSLYASMFLTPALLQQDPGAQTATVSATVSAGDVLTTTINPGNGGGATVSYTVSAALLADAETAGQSAATVVATAIAAGINTSTAVDPATQLVGPPLQLNQRYLASTDGGVITIKAGFTLGCTTSPAAATEQYQPLVAPVGSLAASVGGTATAGDVLTTTIDGLAVPYTVPASATPDSIAAGIAAAINGASALDPLSGSAISAEFRASSSGSTVTIAQASGTGFTLGCAVSAAGSSATTETYTSQSPICQMATVSGSVTAGDTLTTTINGVTIPYTVLATDTIPSVAAGIAAAINAWTGPDPYSGLPLNDLVVATSSGPNLTVLGANAGAPFTLVCALVPPGVGSADASSYTAIEPTLPCWTATLSGTVKVGDTLVTTINGVALSYAAAAGDTAAITALATSVAAAINATTELDPTTQLPLSTIVHAASAAGADPNTAVVTITAVDPSTAFTVASSVTSGGESYLAAGPLAASAVATVSGAIPAGATLTTTINDLAVLYPVTSVATPTSVAQGIATAINNTTTADPITSQQLNKVVQAVAGTDAQGDGLVTVTASNPTTQFTIEVAMTASGYTAGRQTPPFADPGSGQFLTDPSQTLFGHEPTLCAACNITGAEFELIAGVLGYDASTPLSLQTVSALFRYGWLAHTLGLSVAEFLLLIANTGLNPFTPLDLGASPSPAEPAVIRFIRLLTAMSTTGLGTDQALYLLWNQDISGTSAPSSSDITGLAIALRAAFATVDAAFTLQDDPSGSIAQGLMTLVYGASATDFFFGLLNATFSTSVPYSAPAGVSGLPQPVLNASTGRLSYNDLTKQLMFAGVLDSASQASIDAALTVDTSSASSTTPGPATFTPAAMTNIYVGSALLIDTGVAQETVVVTAVSATTFTAETATPHNGSVTPFPIVSDPTLTAAVTDLAAANLAATAPFFAIYPELRPLYLAYIASTDPPQTKRTTLLANFLPVLISERKQEQALASVTSTAGTDQSFAAALLQDPSVLHADADASAAAVTDFTAIEQQGLAAQFFLTNDLTAPPDLQAGCAPGLSYAQTATIGGTMTTGEILTTTIAGVAVAYTVGTFTLSCAVSAGATETLLPASQPSAVSQNATVSGNTITAGDTLTMTVDGVSATYTVVAGDTATTIAANLAAAINATTVEDPTVGAPLNQVLTASSAGSVVTVTVLPGAASTAAPQVAAGVAAAINATTTPVAGVPLNQIAAASASGNTVVLDIANPGTGGHFTLACAVTGGASTTYTTGTQLPSATGGGKLAAVWSGYLTAPQSGAYAVNVAADTGATITLEVDGLEVLSGIVGGGGMLTNQTEISLVAGELVPISLTARSISTALSVSWQSQGIGWQAIPGQYLYSTTLINQLTNSYVRFLKAASLAGTLSLTAQEISWLGTASSFSVNTTATSPVATTPGPATTFTPASMTNIEVGTRLVIDGPASIPDPVSGIDTPGSQEVVKVTGTTSTTFTATTTKPHGGSSAPFPIVTVTQSELGQGWINSLAGEPTDLEQTAATDLAPVLMALLNFARIKQALSPTDSRLLQVLQDPGATLPNSQSTPAGQPQVLSQSALLSLTGWSKQSLAALLTQFFPDAAIANLSSVENFRRVYDAFTLVNTSRLSASVLISGITNAPSATTVSTLQSALRSQYAPADWLTVVTPINNAARIAQRDALVAYIVQQEGDLYEALQVPFSTSGVVGPGATQLAMTSTAGTASTLVSPGMTVQGTNIAAGTTVTAVSGDAVTISTGVIASLAAGTNVTFAPSGPAISTADDLYAYLMIDPENQPPVLTSRILLATLTVQLFIERVIRNLEPQVSPADINDAQWTWMKRYRVWQANREVFLWPENWLYPELRDNQSSFFQTTMSALLQGDIDDDAATSAYLDYLTSLEEVAKLEACGMYYQPATSDTDETALVVSRTAGAHRKYYFRELSSGSWQPWSEAQIDCEDLPLTPVVWNGRLFLFWLKIIKQNMPAPLDSSTVTEPASTAVANYTIGDFTNLQKQNTDTTKQNVVSIGAVLCWSEYYNGKWQPTKTSDVNLPTSLSRPAYGGGLGYFPATGPGSFEQSTRGLLRLVPVMFTGSNPLAQDLKVQSTLPSDALIIAIAVPPITSYGFLYAPFQYGGFVLHNTHSLPVRLEDMYVQCGTTSAPQPLFEFLDLPSPSRTLTAAPSNPPSPAPPAFSGAFGDGGFSIFYENTLGAGKVYSNSLLDYDWGPRFVEPQPGLPWDAPFIYEDRRNIFYVNTTATTHTYDYPHLPFGVLSNRTVSVPSIPRLVMRAEVSEPDAITSGSTTAVEGGTIARYVVQDTDLNAALNSSTPVTYQGRLIAPTTSVAAPNAGAGTNGEGAQP